MSNLLPESAPRHTPDLAPKAPEDRRRLLPWVAVSLPFTALLIFVIWLLQATDFGGRLHRLQNTIDTNQELYAIRQTPPSSVELLLDAATKEPKAWSAGQVWALSDLQKRAKLPIWPKQAPLGLSAEQGQQGWELARRFAAEWTRLRAETKALLAPEGEAPASAETQTKNR